MPTVPPLIQHLDHANLPAQQRLILTPSPLLLFQVRHHHHRERVLVFLQFLPPLPVVQQFDRRELEQTPETPPCHLESLRAEVGMSVRQHRQADHLHSVPVQSPVVVDEHPPGELLLRVPLHLDVDHQPAFSTVLEVHLHQHIGDAPPGPAPLCDLLQLFVQELISLDEINVLRHFGEEEPHKVLEVTLDRFLPDAVLTHRFLLRFRPCPSHGRATDCRSLHHTQEMHPP